MEKTAYEILGVSPTATDEEIKRQYHTLIKNVHSDTTSLKDLTEEERQKCEKLVREYNEAYGKLSKGKRADYDKDLAQRREASNIINNKSSYSKASGFTSDNVQNHYKSEDKEKGERTVEKSDAQKIMEQILMKQLDELMKSIFKSGYSFSGSFTTDTNQRLKQDYWKLKSKRDKLEKDLRTAEQDATIEFMKKGPTNEVQLNIDFRNLSSKIASLEVKRNVDLVNAQQSYVSKASKRFITQRKREMLKQKLEQEEAQINAKYNMMIGMYKEKQNRNRMELEKYQKALKEAVRKDSRVLTIQTALSQVQLELNSIGERLGYQPRTSDYTSGYGERSRVSV